MSSSSWLISAMSNLRYLWVTPMLLEVSQQLVWPAFFKDRNLYVSNDKSWKIKLIFHLLSLNAH